MRIGVRTVVPALVIALSALALGACSDSDNGGGGNVASFCSDVQKNSDALNRPAVGVGVDNQTILESHVDAVIVIHKSAPAEIKPQVSYIEDKAKAFLEAWRDGGFRSSTMPEFDPELGARYKALDDFAEAKCGVKLTN